LQFLDRTVTEGFVKPVHRDMVHVADDPAVLLDRMAAHRPTHVEKWIRPAETLAEAGSCNPPMAG
jgi:predicted Rossmann-fold nucleotide-binding protein